MSIAVLMTCHNRVEMTLACLRRLMPQLSPTDGVFLVDDGSTDGTGARVHADFPSVHVINADGTLYWAKGMRLAWESALASANNYDLFLWLNDDVVLKSNALALLLKDLAASGDSRSVIIGACADDETETASSYAATDLRDVRYEPNGSTLQKASGWFNGNVVLIPSKTASEVGLISGDYSHARADYDYAERLKRAGVPFWASTQYVGICKRDNRMETESKGLLGRLHGLCEPGNCNVRDLWLYRYRYWGFAKAIISVCHLLWVVLFQRKRNNVKG